MLNNKRKCVIHEITLTCDQDRISPYNNKQMSDENKEKC